MTGVRRTLFRDLTVGECRSVLTKHNTGRLAFTFHDRVDIETINYVVIDDATLAFRTVPGSKVDAFRHHPWVAIEIDEVKGLQEWKSVVVHGTIYPVSDVGTPYDRATYTRVMKGLRYLMPSAKRDDDPPADRPIALAFHIDRLRGREAKSSRTKEAP